MMFLLGVLITLGLFPLVTAAGILFLPRKFTDFVLDIYMYPIAWAAFHEAGPVVLEEDVIEELDTPVKLELVKEDTDEKQIR